MHLYRFGYILSPALKQYSSKADKNEDKNKSNTKKLLQVWNQTKCYENVTRCITNTWSETLQPFCAIVLSHRTKHYICRTNCKTFQYHRSFFFLSLYWLLQIPLLCWDFLRFMHFSLFQKISLFFQPIFPRKFFTIFQTMFLSFDKYINVENYTSNQTAREKKTKLVL